MKTKNLSQTSWFTKQWQNLIWPQNYLPQVGLESPVPEKIWFKNNYEREKDRYLQFHKLYVCTWVITTEFCSINLVEEEANETPRQTIFIYYPFHEGSYWENSNKIKYPLSFVPDCCGLMSEPFLKVNFIALTWHYAIILAYCELQGVSFEKLVLPHDDIGQSLHTFLKGGCIPEALLSNTNPNNWGDSLVSRNIVLPLLQS